MNEWKKYHVDEGITIDTLYHSSSGSLKVQIKKQREKDGSLSLVVIKDRFRRPHGEDLAEPLDIVNNPDHRTICNNVGLWFLLNLDRGMESVRIVDDEALQMAFLILQHTSEAEHNGYHPYDDKAEVANHLMNIPEGIRPPLDPKGITYYEDLYLQNNK